MRDNSIPGKPIPMPVEVRIAGADMVTLRQEARK